MRQAGVLAAAARQAVVENFGLGNRDTKGVLRNSRVLAERVGRMWIERGGRLLKPVETNMAWLNLKSCNIDVKEWNALGRENRIKLDGKRVVLHHQIDETAMERLATVMNLALGHVAEGGIVCGTPRARL